MNNAYILRRRHEEKEKKKLKIDYCMIIKNALTGEQIKISNAQDLSVFAKNSIIEAYTEKWTKDNIGYYVSYLYEQ